MNKNYLKKLKGKKNRKKYIKIYMKVSPMMDP